MHEDDNKLTRALHKRLLTTKLSGIAYALLILSLSLGVSFIFSYTARAVGGVFYAFIFFIPILLSFTLLAIYFRLKIAWGKSSAAYIVTFLGIILLFVFLVFLLPI
ncbi:hypothetical protein IIC45_02110 [Patescibacteria group bacterium]|nr:hypothetical protein [Patescibacteria group bacterium]